MAGSATSTATPPSFREPTLAGPAYLATTSQVYIIDTDGTTDVVLEDEGIVLLEVEPTGDAFVTSSRGLTRISGREAKTVATSALPEAFHLAVGAGNDIWALTQDAPYQLATATATDAVLTGSSWSERPLKVAATTEPQVLRDITMDAKGNVWLAAGPRGLFQWQAGAWQKAAEVAGNVMHVSPDGTDGIYVLTDRGYSRVSNGAVSEVFWRDKLNVAGGEIRRNGSWTILSKATPTTRSFILGKDGASHWEDSTDKLGAGVSWITVDTRGRMWAPGKRTLTIAAKGSEPIRISLSASVAGDLIWAEAVGSGPEKLPVEIGPTVSLPEAAAPSASSSGTKPNRGMASIGGASVSGGAVANASAVVAGMAAGFRRCYNRGLSEDPNMKGTVRVTAKIGPAGEVLSAVPSGGGGLSKTVASCVASRVASAQFSAPDGGGATIIIPVSFSPG